MHNSTDTAIYKHSNKWNCAFIEKYVILPWVAVIAVIVATLKSKEFKNIKNKIITE
jgi:hypothetical protein